MKVVVDSGSTPDTSIGELMAKYIVDVKTTHNLNPLKFTLTIHAKTEKSASKSAIMSIVKKYTFLPERWLKVITCIKAK